MKFLILLPSLLASLTAAHFTINYPPSRGTDPETQSEFPCGGFSRPSIRTKIPLYSPSFPISVDMGHDQTAIRFLLAVGSAPGTNYNITLSKTFRVEGLGEFCVPDVVLSEDILGTKLEDELNMTLQVQANGHPDGGLYACADLQLTTEPVSGPSKSACKNNTGVVAVPFTGAAADRNANVSTPEGWPQGGEDTKSKGESHAPFLTGGSALQAASWGVLGVLGVSVLGSLIIW